MNLEDDENDDDSDDGENNDGKDDNVIVWCSRMEWHDMLEKKLQISGLLTSNRLEASVLLRSFPQARGRRRP